MSAIFEREALAALLERERAASLDATGSSTVSGLGRVVLANGCFDLLHVGHARYLADAMKKGVEVGDDVTTKLRFEF